MLDPDLKKLLNVLDFETKKKYHSFRAGGLSPNTRGRGIEFKEVRPYNYGDDTRYIDWNVTSRTGEVHVKEFFAEQDVPVIIHLDCSNSMIGIKKNVGSQLAFFLALYHIKIGNRVRILLFGENVYHSGRELRRENDVYSEFNKILEKMKTVSGQYTDYNKSLEFGMKISPKFAISYWLSDFTYFDGFNSRKGFFNRWEQYGIWIEEYCLELDLPFWFRLFDFFDSEGHTPLTNKSSLTDDKSNFKKCFGLNQILIRPEDKLSKQIIALFKRNQS